MNVQELLTSLGAKAGGFIRVDSAPRTSARPWNFPEGSFVIPFSIPYYCGKPTNLANFAAAPDYHVYAGMIDSALKEYFAEKYPDRYVRVFADVSPFDERLLAAGGGLGIIGDHGMLITPDYSSFVVLGEAVMELDPDELAAEGISPADGEIAECEHCGLCQQACPMGGIKDKSRCLSALTQKKGELSADEEELIRKHSAVWGCDRCVFACPHTSNPPKETAVPYFNEGRLGVVTDGDILRMSPEEYKRYSFSWRKPSVIVRNLRLCGFCDPKINPESEAEE